MAIVEKERRSEHVARRDRTTRKQEVSLSLNSITITESSFEMLPTTTRVTVFPSKFRTTTTHRLRTVCVCKKEAKKCVAMTVNGSQ